MGTMGYSHIFEGTDAEFNEKVSIIPSQLMAKASIWGTDLQAVLAVSDAYAAWQLKWAAFTRVNHSSLDTKNKNIGRKVFTGVLRQFFKQYIINNPEVSDEDKALLGFTLNAVPNRDKEKKPIFLLLTGKASNPESGVILVIFDHIVVFPGAVLPKRLNRLLRSGIFPAGVVPGSPDELPNLVSTHRDRLKIRTKSEDQNKTMWFSARIEDTTGVAGRWGPLFYAVIT